MNAAVGGISDDDAIRRDEAALVARILAGEPHLYGILVERYQRRLFWACRRLLDDPDEADDVVQEAFVRAWQHLAGFDPAYRFYTWLYTIARNRALNVLRRRKVRGDVPLPDDGVRDPAAPARDAASARVEDAELAAALDACRQALPDDQREAFDLRHADGLSYGEIARATGAPEGTVMSRLYRARERMRQCLSAKGVTWP